MTIKKMVDISLLVAFIGAFVFYPFQQRWWGGIIFATCNAAVVGGLADTFAIRAFVGEPLNIRWPKFMGTRMITRNRQRLIADFVFMIEHELLPAKNIIAYLKNYDFTQFFRTYFFNYDGVQHTQQLFKHLWSEPLHQHLKRLLLQSSLQPFNIEMIVQLGKKAVATNFDQRLIQSGGRLLEQLVRTTPVQQAIETLITRALATYTNKNKSRALLSQLASIDPTTLSHLVQQRIIDQCLRMQQPTDSLHMSIRTYVQHFLADLENNTPTRHKLEQLLLTFRTHLNQNIDLQQLIHHLLRTDDLTHGSNRVLAKWLKQALDHDSLMEAVSKFIQHHLFKAITNYHQRIGEVVTQALHRYTDQQFIDFIYEKAGRDLQFIRLNGTIVGGIVGLLLYLFTKLITWWCF